MTRTSILASAAVALLLTGCATHTPVKTHFNKGVDFYDSKNYSGAAREYRLAIEEDPMDFRAHFNLAVTLEELGRTDLARAEYEWMLSVRPEDLRASVNLAAIEIDAGEIEAGYARLQALADRYPTLALPRVALATHYLRDGRLDEAERLVRDALASDDSDIEGNFLLGEILARRAGLMEASERAAVVAEARKAFERALANEPNDVASLLALGRLEQAEGRPDRARSYYRRVVLLRRRSAEAHEALAAINEADGCYEAAVHHLWELRSIDRSKEAFVSSRLVRLYAELLRQEELRTAESRPASEPP